MFDPPANGFAYVPGTSHPLVKIEPWVQYTFVESTASPDKTHEVFVTVATGLATQSPDEQTAPWQLWPQNPQLLESIVISTHWLPQTICGSGHWHWPSSHDVPTTPQIWLQPPQLLLSVSVLTQ